MDYFKIVLEGYGTPNNRENLAEYFFSEFKKAEKDNFTSANLFFGGCMKVIELLNENYNEQVNEQKRMLNQYLISEGNKDQEFIKDFKEQIEFLKTNGNTNLRLSNGRILHLTKDEISYIENGIQRAELTQKIAEKTELLKTAIEQRKGFVIDKEPQKDFKTENWFKVGLLFAQGKVQPFYIDYKQRTMSFNDITKKLGLDIKKHRTYISSTLNKNEDEPKNIYSSQKKIKQIHSYCIENNIEMCDDFLNQIKPD